MLKSLDLNLCVAVAAGLLLATTPTLAKPPKSSAGIWVEANGRTRAVKLPSLAPLVKKVEPTSLVVFTKSRVTEMVLPKGHPALPPEGMRMPSEVQGQGSGFLIHPSGLALTNHHVVENALDLWVLVGTDPREIKAEVIGSDARTDVALLRLIDPKRKTPWPAVPLGDSAKLQVGDFVVAVGNPFGLAQTVSMGILSARHRKNIAPSGRRGLYDFLQTDASINVGNSGGPLLNLRGEVIGINTAVNSAASGIGFAIPINMVKAMLPALKRDGKVARSWIGVQINPVTRDIASGLGLDRPRGALITRVLDIGPAGEAGVAVGDVVVVFDGVALEDASDLPLLAGSRGVGEVVKLDIIRDSKPIQIELKLGSLPEQKIEPTSNPVPPPPEEKKKTRLGFFVSDLNKHDRKRLNLNAESKGAILLKVGPGSAAANAGLRVDDIIVGLDGDKVKNAGEFGKRIKAKKPGDLLRLIIVREGGTIFVPIPVP